MEEEEEEPTKGTENAAGGKENEGDSRKRSPPPVSQKIHEASEISGEKKEKLGRLQEEEAEVEGEGG